MMIKDTGDDGDADADAGADADVNEDDGAQLNCFESDINYFICICALGYMKHRTGERKYVFTAKSV